MVAVSSDGRIEIVVSGYTRDDLRRSAMRECERRFGGRRFELREEEFRPRLISLGGRVRLLEGRFEGVRS